MTVSKNPLLITLIILQIATLCCMGLLFFNSPTKQDSPGLAITGNNWPADNRAVPFTGLETELRAMRAEIAALRAASGDLSPTDTRPQLSEQELQAQEQAVNASTSVIRGAVSAGVWTRTDTQALMGQLDSVSPEQRLELVKEFYAAINRQELVLKDFPPL
jgi:hypothetical protein